MRISLNIPIYNERNSIEPLYDQLVPVLEGLGCEFEIIITNDGSTDGSNEVVDALAARDPRVKVLHLRRNYGQTAALMAAIRHSSGEVIVPMDGDLQNEPKDIPRLLDKLEEGYDVVSGWRKERKEGLSRRLLSQVANWLASKVFVSRSPSSNSSATSPTARTSRAIRGACRTSWPRTRVWSRTRRFLADQRRRYFLHCSSSW